MALLLGCRMTCRTRVAVIALMMALGACSPTTGATLSTVPLRDTVTPALTPAPEIVSPAAQAACAPPGAQQENWLSICNTYYGYGFQYPSDGTPPDNSQGYEHIQLPFKQGTNLSEKYLDVTVSEGAAMCSNPQAAGSEPGAVPPENVTYNGMTFLKESGANLGAGNIYQWESYSTPKGSLCVSLTFVLHSGNRLNYEVPPPEFDQAAESAIFPTIVSTFYWLNP